MKRYFPWIALVLAAGWVAASLAPPKLQRDGTNLVTFGKIPVLVAIRSSSFTARARFGWPTVKR
jgi:hypothetical protein